MPCRHCTDGNASRKKESRATRNAPTLGDGAGDAAFLQERPVVDASRRYICGGCNTKLSKLRAKHAPKGGAAKAAKGGTVKGGGKGAGRGRGGRGASCETDATGPAPRLPNCLASPLALPYVWSSAVPGSPLPSTEAPSTATPPSAMAVDAMQERVRRPKRRRDDDCDTPAETTLNVRM